MTNLRKFACLISLSRSRYSNFTSTARNYSNFCYNICTPTHNGKNYLATLKTNRLLYQIESCNILLSRNIFVSNVCAKSMNRGGEKKKPKAAKLDLQELGKLCDVEDLTIQMSGAVEQMKTDFIQNLTLRSTSGSVEHIPLEFDGKEYQIQELAQISRKPKLIVLNCSSFPTAIPHIIKAIGKSGLNINPQQEGTTLYLPIPKVTKEHRENLSKNAKAIFIKRRDQIKDIKVKAVKKLQKKSDVSSDAIRRVENQLEALCVKYLKEAEIVLETKQNELSG